MADSHQENEDNTGIPDTNEGDSNDVEDADEVIWNYDSVLFCSFISIAISCHKMKNIMPAGFRGCLSSVVYWLGCIWTTQEFIDSFS